MAKKEKKEQSIDKFIKKKQEENMAFRKLLSAMEKNGKGLEGLTGTKSVNDGSQKQSHE